MSAYASNHKTQKRDRENSYLTFFEHYRWHLIYINVLNKIFIRGDSATYHNE